jgi:hypothetical protein
MPTDKNSLNPGGLMKAARRARHAQARTQATADMLLSLLGHSEVFAAQFDEAVARKDKKMILSLVAEAGTPDDIEVTIEDLDPDRSITLKICWGPFHWYCIGGSITW